MTLTPAGIAGADDDPLAPEPANLTGALIGYARVSTSGQILDRQIRALTEAAASGSSPTSCRARPPTGPSSLTCPNPRTGTAQPAAEDE